MSILRIIAAATALIVGAAFPVGGAAASQLQCRHTAADYAQAIRHFEGEAAKARMLAERNPLHESDVAYYTSVLADARACQRQLNPVATASR